MKYSLPTLPLISDFEGFKNDKFGFHFWLQSPLSHPCIEMEQHIWNLKQTVIHWWLAYVSLDLRRHRPVLQSLVASLVLTRLDYGISTLASLPVRQLNRLQSVVNSAARLLYLARRSEHVSPLLQELHWLRIPERIDLRVAVLVYRCMNGTAPHYLGSELQWVADIESRRRLRPVSSPSLHVPRSLHKTICDRAFPVAAAKVWNMLPPAITSLPSLEAFKRALKTELFCSLYGNAHCRQQ